MTTATQAQRILVAVQALKQCPICHAESCECWTSLAWLAAHETEDARKLTSYPALVAACRAALRYIDPPLGVSGGPAGWQVTKMLRDALAADGADVEDTSALKERATA